MYNMYLRLVHLVEHVPNIVMRNPALGQCSRGPTIRKYSFVLQGKANQEPRDVVWKRDKQTDRSVEEETYGEGKHFQRDKNVAQVV